ncbi:hypothetical protein ISF_04005 [Cordyceps fumosorosea ARSEF 2679]|uniref:DUF6590 domain-containing protein n=1 Tax=Cordyceps fumosorosea (strain ARSEF 2679) TaxID=1081104 RepID=A0A167YCK3_CORFA|nr:hypothetical protein ISF_04005 [Cordyceps fumosorosea ARSEF 2679]OAA66167.1 hypothetical protein ISF_04005 [Cordyceps fumosorosea ARSEF 2679]
MHTNKHKSKSKSHRWGAWSEWTWDSSQQANFRVRQDSQVELPDDYAAYAGEAPPEQAKAKKTKLKSKDKEKPKSHRRHASSDGKSSAASQDDTAHPHSPGLQFVESAHGDEYQQQAPTANVNYSQYGSGRVAYSSAWPSRARRYAAFTDESEAAASSSQTSSTTAAQQYAGDDFDGAAAPPRHGQVRSESDGGSPTPQQSETAETADADYMPEMAENGETELDPRYQIEHSARFQPGEIFKVHWSEPQGSMSEKPKSSSSSSSSSKKQDLENKFGTKFFVGFRRFIVVANDQGHCTCVPILTYGGKGCKKHGLVTVEHNVKVFFIGHVYPGDWQIVGDAVNYCWNKKIHQKQQRHK